MNGVRKKDWRLLFVMAIFMVGAIGILLRLFFLQVTQADYYRDIAEEQHAAVKTFRAERGDIFFQDKTGRLIPAATTNVVYTLHARPKEIEDIGSTHEALKPFLSIGREDFEKALGSGSDMFAIIARNIPKDTVSSIMALELPGIDYAVEEVRVYPGGALASQVIGFLGFAKDATTRVGQYGIEKEFDSVLSTSNTGDSENSDSFLRSFLSIGERLFSSDEGGADIVLTIDPDVQSFVEQEMARTRETWHGTRAGAMVMEPKTGRILAMGAYPTFDPNAYGKETDFDVFINPFVQEIHEMGSVFKPLTMAAALDARVVTPETTYNDTGKLVIDGRTIENFDGVGRGIQTMTNVLQQSLNTGSVFAMRKLGKERFHSYFMSYGLNQPTGIDLPGEATGNMNNLDSGREVEYATASFGQGVAVSFVELASALSSLGNGGEIPQPHVVDRVMRDGKVIREMRPEMRGRVISPEASHTISQMLTKVVDTTLANGKAKIPGYSMGAKTGTAQMPSEKTRGYSDEYLHTYFGYAPSFDPRFLVVLFVEKPQGVRYSSESLTDPFRNIMKFLITYYEVPPDRPIN